MEHFIILIRIISYFEIIKKLPLIKLLTITIIINYRNYLNPLVILHNITLDLEIKTK